MVIADSTLEHQPIVLSTGYNANITPPLTSEPTLEPSPEIVTETATTEAATATFEPTAEITEIVLPEITAEITAEQTESLQPLQPEITNTATQSIPLVPEPTLAPILSEAFHTDDLSRWQVGAGWELVAQEPGFALQVTNSDAAVTSNSGVYGDIAVEMLVQSASSTFNLHLRDAYTLTLYPTGQVDLYHGTDLLATTTVAVSDTWRHVRFSAMGDTLRVAIDDVEIIALRDSTPTLTAGQIAFNATFPQQPENSEQLNTLLVDNIRFWIPESAVATATSTPEITAIPPLEVTAEAAVVESLTTPTIPASTQNVPYINPVPDIIVQHVEDFEDGTIDSSVWTVNADYSIIQTGEGHALQLGGGELPLVYAGGDIDNFALSVDVWMETETFQIEFRRSVEGSYRATFAPSGEVQLYRGTELLQTAHITPVTTGAWYTVQVAAFYDGLHLNINGQAIIGFSDDIILPAGSIVIGGGGTSDNQITVDNVVFRSRQMQQLGQTLTAQQENPIVAFGHQGSSHILVNDYLELRSQITLINNNCVPETTTTLELQGTDAQYMIADPDPNGDLNGSSGLPVIRCDIEIEGHNLTLSRSSTADFRILAVDDGAKLTLRNVTVTGGDLSAVGWSGGGIYSLGTLILEGVKVIENYASSGGGIRVGAGLGSPNNYIIIDDSDTNTSEFRNNEANRSGGGIYIFNVINIQILNSLIDNNKANITITDGGAGGGAYIFGKSNVTVLTVENTTFTDNTARQGGNNADHGGGLYAINLATGSLIANNSFIRNFAHHSGGGLFVRDTVTIRNNLFQENSTGTNFSFSKGNALYMQLSVGSQAIHNCFVNNFKTSVYFAWDVEGQLTIDNITNNWWNSSTGPELDDDEVDTPETVHTTLSVSLNGLTYLTSQPACGVPPPISVSISTATSIIPYQTTTFAVTVQNHTEQDINGVTVYLSPFTTNPSPVEGTPFFFISQGAGEPTIYFDNVQTIRRENLIVPANGTAIFSFTGKPKRSGIHEVATQVVSPIGSFDSSISVSVNITNLDFAGTHAALKSVMFWAIYHETSDNRSLTVQNPSNPSQVSLAGNCSKDPLTGMDQNITRIMNGRTYLDNPSVDPNGLGDGYCYDHRYMEAHTILNGFLNHERQHITPGEDLIHVTNYVVVSNFSGTFANPDNLFLWEAHRQCASISNQQVNAPIPVEEYLTIADKLHDARNVIEHYKTAYLDPDATQEEKDLARILLDTDLSVYRQKNPGTTIDTHQLLYDEMVNNVQPMWEVVATEWVHAYLNCLRDMDVDNFGRNYNREAGGYHNGPTALTYNFIAQEQTLTSYINRAIATIETGGACTTISPDDALYYQCDPSRGAVSLKHANVGGATGDLTTLVGADANGNWQTCIIPLDYVSDVGTPSVCVHPHNVVKGDLTSAYSHHEQQLQLNYFPSDNSIVQPVLVTEINRNQDAVGFKWISNVYQQTSPNFSFHYPR